MIPCCLGNQNNKKADGTGSDDPAEYTWATEFKEITRAPVLAEVTPSRIIELQSQLTADEKTLIRFVPVKRYDELESATLAETVLDTLAVLDYMRKIPVKRFDTEITRILAQTVAAAQTLEGKDGWRAISLAANLYLCNEEIKKWRASANVQLEQVDLNLFRKIGGFKCLRIKRIVINTCVNNAESGTQEIEVTSRASQLQAALWNLSRVSKNCEQYGGNLLWACNQVNLAYPLNKGISDALSAVDSFLSKYYLEDRLSEKPVHYYRSEVEGPFKDAIESMPSILLKEGNSSAIRLRWNEFRSRDSTWTIQTTHSLTSFGGKQVKDTSTIAIRFKDIDKRTAFWNKSVTGEPLFVDSMGYGGLGSLLNFHDVWCERPQRKGYMIPLHQLTLWNIPIVIPKETVVLQNLRFLVIGSELVNSHECLKMSYLPPVGKNVMQVWIDTKSGLLVKANIKWFGEFTRAGVTGPGYVEMTMQERLPPVAPKKRKS